MVPDRARFGAILAEGSDGAPNREQADALFELIRGGGESEADPGRRQRPRRRRGPWPRLTLVPAAVVRRIADRLVRLAGWRGLAAQALFGMAGYVAGAVIPGPAIVVDRGPPWAQVWFWGVALLLATALWHELGHAAALARAGYRPGRIGGGLLVVVPVLWCDVSTVSLLGRIDRLRVDLAGVCWQLGLGGALSAAAKIGEAAVPVAVWPRAAQLAAAGVLASCLWSAIPFLRTDGSWLLRDALGVDDLEAPAPAAAGPKTRMALAGYRAANLLFLGAVAVWLPLRLGAALWPGTADRPVLRASLAAVWAVVMAFVWRNAIRRGTRLARAARADLGAR